MKDIREIIEWRPIAGYEGRYEVSSLGKVRSLDYRGVKGWVKELSPTPNNKGYLQVSLFKKGKEPWHASIHRLVAKAFMPNPHNYLEVNHIDEDKTNNCVTNLEWCTRKHNMNHGTVVKRSSENRSKSVEAIDPSSGIVIHRFISTSEAQRHGFASSHISNCCRGKEKTHKGFTWKYVETLEESV